MPQDLILKCIQSINIESAWHANKAEPEEWERDEEKKIQKVFLRASIDIHYSSTIFLNITYLA